MTTVITEETSRLKLLFTLYTLMLFIIFAMMVIRSPESVRTSIESELDYTAHHLGTIEQNRLEEITKKRFQGWVHDSGFYNIIYQAIAPKDDSVGLRVVQQSERSHFFHEGWIWRLLENLQLFSYQIIHRLTLMEFWLLTMLPSVVAITMTGYYNWKIKKYQLAGHSTRQVRIWLKSLWIILMVFSVYLITPNIFGTYTIYAPPLLMIMVALSLSLILSNFGKST